MIKTDFHCHSNCSDGLLSPEEVVNRAIKNGVKILALTDHDTIDGIDLAIEASKNSDLTIIPGIELSTNYKGESIHVLGFFNKDSYKNSELIEFLNGIKNERFIRAKKMVDKLKELNIHIDFQNVLNRGKEVVARPHIAHEIIASGYDYTFDYIFDNFIGKGCPAYIQTNKLTVKDGVSLIHKFNGIAILAHPILIKNSKLEEFLDFNIDGIEAIYYQNTQAQTERLKDFAKKHNLLITAGSDCHGNFVNDTRHGDIGDVTLTEPYLSNFLNALK